MVGSRINWRLSCLEGVMGIKGSLARERKMCLRADVVTIVISYQVVGKFLLWFVFFFSIAGIPIWTYFDRHIICMTKAILNMKKKCCLTSFIFKQTQTRPVPNPDHPCEVILQSQWHSLCAVWRVGVRFNIHLGYFRITIYIYKIWLTNSHNLRTLVVLWKDWNY